MGKKSKVQKIKIKEKRKLEKQDTQKEIKKLKNKKKIDFNKKNKKQVKIAESSGNLTRKKRLKWELFIAYILLTCLLVRVGIIQFIQGEELQSMAYMQQTLDRNINPKRGTIYDATGKTVLAVSSTVQTITVNPTNISEENKEKVSRALSDIFELEYEKVLKKVKKRSAIETIVKKVDKEKSDKLRIWMYKKIK